MTTLNYDLQKDFDNAYDAIKWLQDCDYKAAVWCALAIVKTLQGYSPNVQDYLNRVTANVERYVRGEVAAFDKEEEVEDDVDNKTHYAIYAAWYLENELTNERHEDSYKMLEPIAMANMAVVKNNVSNKMYQQSRKQIYQDWLPVIAEAMTRYPAS